MATLKLLHRLGLIRRRGPIRVERTVQTEDYVLCLATHEDKLVVGFLRKIEIWNTSSWTRVHTLEGHTSWVRDFASCGDGKLISCSNDGTIKIWSKSWH